MRLMNITPNKELDDLLNSFKSDMDVINHGQIKTQIKGYCAKCNLMVPEDQTPIYTTDRRVLHKECYKCLSCKKYLQGIQVYESEIGFQCCECYINSCDTCHSCKEKIKNGQVVKAQDKLFHPECFNCSKCKGGIKGSFFVDNGNFLCDTCYETDFLPICARCQKRISEKTDKDVKAEFFVVGDLQLHKQCFNCFECSVEFPDGKAFTNSNKLYCHDHYKVVKQQSQRS
eukprot:NODE_107_length_18988_cov_0.534491.p9 type:complete len:229 gc:universal NODE_107_length_18988_cov_0.534491:15942-16628(+)